MLDYARSRGRRGLAYGLTVHPVVWAACAAAVAFSLNAGPAGAARDVALLDVIELDMGYTTITDNYYRSVAPQRLLDGARVGIVAYLVSRGIADPNVPLRRARPDGRGVVPAIERDLGEAIDRYGPRVDPRELVYAAVRGELAALHDPYSVFFTRRELHGFSGALDGTSFGGIGIVLALGTDDRYRADSVFDGSPAARAGVVAGDTIVGVDGTPLAGLPVAAIRKLLRGRVGTVVRLSMLHAGEAAPRDVAIVRAAIVPPDVTARDLPGKIGYVALRTFGPDAGTQIHAALAKQRAGGARATIFDLRGNGGGYESSAVHVASAFVPSGAILITQTRHGRRIVTAADGTALPPQPLVVLVDGDSASGSELVTGAIADHGLGTILGTRTFGKGLVQTIYPLPDGSAIKVTTARYFTPNGRDIDRIGITPDIVVAEPADSEHGVPGRDAQLDAALTLLARATPAPGAPANHR